MNRLYFVSGIDTDIGKSYATGMLARLWMKQGKKVMTQKLVQTGDSGISMDIQLHRKIMGIPVTPDDQNGTTCPMLFSFPASPHLAAEIDKREIEVDKIDQSTAYLRKKYDVLLLEGAGGLLVPLTRQLMTADFVAQRNIPMILVTSGRLGSLNHTLLTLESMERRNISLAGICYNYSAVADPLIEKDTLDYLKKYLADYAPKAWMIKIGKIDIENPDKTEIDYVANMAEF